MKNSINILFDQENKDKMEKCFENEEESVKLKRTTQNFSSTLPMKLSKKEEGKKVFTSEKESEEMKRKQHISSQSGRYLESKKVKKSNFSSQNFCSKLNENENNQQETKNKKIKSQFPKKTQKEYKFSNERDIQTERQIEGVKKQINNNVDALQKLIKDKITKNANKQKMNESFSNTTSFYTKSKNVNYSTNKQKIIPKTSEDKKPKESNQKMKNKMEIVQKKQQSGKILSKINDKKATTDVKKLNTMNNNDKERKKKLELKDTKKKENLLKQKKTKTEHVKINESKQEEKENDKSLADVSKECKITSIQEETKEKETKKSDNFQKTHKDLFQKVEDHINSQKKQQVTDQNENSSAISKVDNAKSNYYQKTMIGLIDKIHFYLNSKAISDETVDDKQLEQVEELRTQTEDQEMKIKNENKLIKNQINNEEIQAPHSDFQNENTKFQQQNSSEPLHINEMKTNNLTNQIEQNQAQISNQVIKPNEKEDEAFDYIQNKYETFQEEKQALKHNNEETCNMNKIIQHTNEIHENEMKINNLANQIEQNQAIKPNEKEDETFECIQNKYSKLQEERQALKHNNEEPCNMNKVFQQTNEMKINNLANQFEQNQEQISNQAIKPNEKGDESSECIQDKYSKLQEERQALKHNNEEPCNMKKIIPHTNEMHENEMKINNLANQIEQSQAQISNQVIKPNEKEDEASEFIQNKYAKLQEEKQVLQEHNLSLQYTNEELQQQIQSLAVKKQENETTIDMLRKEIELLQEKISDQNKENKIEIRNENNHYQIFEIQSENDKSFTESSKLYTDSPDELESNTFYSSDELNYYNYNENSYIDLSDFKQNFDLYLRCLVKFSDEHPIKYDEIPKEFSDFFSIIGVSQASNISIGNPLPKDLTKIENYIDENQHFFSKFNEVAEGIRNNFQSDIEKMYAAYYFVTHHVEYDIQKKLSTNREDSSIEKIFDTKKGVCSDYSKLFIEIMKKSGVSSKKIPMVYYVNASKSSNWNSFRPSPNPYFNHAAVLIKINNEYYISEPTWGAGITNKDDEYQVNYRKSYFLIPYFKGVLSHFPKNAYDETLQIHFTWEQFASLNNPNISKELAFESNPFQKITVNDGFYDFQFSFVQPVESISAKIYLLDEKIWKEQRENLISFECIEKNLPNHCFSFYPSELRCRYKMRASFIEIGQYRVETYLNLKLLFIVYFDVKSISRIKIGIPGCFKEKNGFEPITPIDGLTKVTNGYARIRFAVKYKNSKTMISLYKIKENTFTRERKYENEYIDSFIAKLPFINYDEKESNDDLVEDWILINFPENGRWEVEIYFQTEKLLMYQYGVKYYFDVEGSGKYNISPLFDFPNNRKFATFDMSIPTKVSLNPQTNAVVLNDYDYDFHVLSDENVNIYIKSDNKSNSEYSSDLLSLLSEKKNDETNLTDYEYSITFPRSDKYNLVVVHDGKIIGSQNFYVIDEELQEETEEEKLLMENLKNKLDGKIDYYKDIPISIRQNVEKMLKRSII